MWWSQEAGQIICIYLLNGVVNRVSIVQWIRPGDQTEAQETRLRAGKHYSAPTRTDSGSVRQRHWFLVPLSSSSEAETLNDSHYLSSVSSVSLFPS